MTDTLVILRVSTIILSESLQVHVLFILALLDTLGVALRTYELRYVR